MTIGISLIRMPCFFRVVFEVLPALEVRVERPCWLSATNCDAVGSLQHELPGRVV
jgi:hypothetical protein